jgi:GNAT superfamily N-acetyltransferase
MPRATRRFGPRRQFLIREATWRDLDILVHQRRGMWQDIGIEDRSSLDEADRAYRKWAKAKLRSGGLVGWIVETPEHTIAGSGCLWLRPEQPRPRLSRLVEPYLLSMFTEPEFRRQGVGSALVKEAVKWCKRNGYPRVLLHASKKGRKLYRQYGFARTWEMRLHLARRRQTPKH